VTLHTSEQLSTQVYLIFMVIVQSRTLEREKYRHNQAFGTVITLSDHNASFVCAF